MTAQLANLRDTPAVTGQTIATVEVRDFDDWRSGEVALETGAKLQCSTFFSPTNMPLKGTQS